MALAVTLSIVVFASTGALSQQILVWDYDNGSTYPDPETGNQVGCEYGIKQALDANGMSYTSTYFLPTDISGYDIVFAVLGLYCVS